MNRKCVLFDSTKAETPTGAFAMNKRIQSIINPASDDKLEIYHSPTHTVYTVWVTE